MEEWMHFILHIRPYLPPALLANLMVTRQRGRGRGDFPQPLRFAKLVPSPEVDVFLNTNLYNFTGIYPNLYQHYEKAKQFFKKPPDGIHSYRHQTHPGCWEDYVPKSQLFISFKNCNFKTNEITCQNIQFMELESNAKGEGGRKST